MLHTSKYKCQKCAFINDKRGGNDMTSCTTSSNYNGVISSKNRVYS